MSPRGWERLARAIEGPSETLDDLCLWAWRHYHKAQAREASGRRFRRSAAPVEVATGAPFPSAAVIAEHPAEGSIQASH